MNKKTDNSGWILCPSKSHPGKFYYFNIHNGESAWSLYDNEKGMFKNDGTLHKIVVDVPKPITPPENQIARTCYNNLRRCSTFGAVKFPKYITSNEDSAIIWAPICKSKLLTNDNTKIDQCTQTDMYFNQSQPTPVFKDFQFNKNTSINALDRSTSANRTDAGQISSKTIPKRGIYSKACLLKETRLKTYQNETEINEKNNCYSNNMQNSTISDGRKVQNTMKDVEELHCDSYDLRFVLRAKKRKSNDTNDTLVSTKEIFNTNGNKGTNTQTDTESTKDWYIVVDSDVLLQEFDFIISYINKDDTCYLYIPKIVEEQLKSAAIGDQSELKSPEISEHWKRKSLAARSIQRRLENYKPKLNLPECTQDTAVNQIVKCCSDIMQRNKDVLLERMTQPA
nr:uncharacterized protein LOC116776504 [Danaus plexippus plexippus]